MEMYGLWRIQGIWDRVIILLCHLNNWFMLVISIVSQFYVN